MNVITRPRMTLEEFLAWERQQEFSHEFDGERIIAMNGGSISHYLIPVNIITALRPIIDGGTFFILTAGVKLVHDGRVRYPDVIVAKAVQDTSVDIIPEPVVVFEIISPTSERRDTVVKNREYRANPSIQQYVVVRQDAMAITSWLREGDAWVGTLLTAGDVLSLPVLGASVPLSAVYENVTMPDPDGEQAEASAP